jgi:dipeptide/tripeptide permease
MWVFYQFPQYISIGLSEVFTSVASLEFAYLAAPESAQSLVMSLRFSSVGLSSLLGSAYVNIYENAYTNFTVTNSEVLEKNPIIIFLEKFLIFSVKVRKNLNYSIFIFLFLLVFN